MTYKFLLPRSYEPSAFLTTPRLGMRADEARWFITTIIRKMVYRDVDVRGYARLHWDVLRRVMSKGTLAEIIKAHVAGGMVETSPYRAGKRSRGYRLTHHYLSDRHVRVPATDPRVIERLEREHDRLAQRQRGLRKPIHDALDAAQRGLTITPMADQILATLPPGTRLCQDVLVGNIRRRTFRFYVSSTGRCFNALTGLKRELRTAVLLDGEPLGSIDLSCAQPALLALYIWLLIPSSGPNSRDTYKECLLRSCPWLPRLCCDEAVEPAVFKTFLWFRDLVCSGSFYDELARLCGLGRDEAKHRSLVDVLAKDGSYPSEVEDVFSATFPGVYRVVREVNRSDHANLIRLLQRLESWLVIETVAPHLVESVPIVTVHDCIFCRVYDLPLVEQAFRETFMEIGFSLALKRETWHGPSYTGAIQLVDSLLLSV